MIGVALLARACGARVTSWNALALAALVVALLVARGGRRARRSRCRSRASRRSCSSPSRSRSALQRVPMHERVREALALTCATQIGTWPLTAAIFSTLAPYAILANAIVVPLIALVLTGGFATLALPSLAPLETLLLR